MGFFGTLFETIEYITDEFNDLCKGISEDAKQLGDELVHINDTSYVSPYAKKQEAAERIDRANRKMNRARERYDSHVKRVERKIEENYRMKRELLGKTGPERRLLSNYSSYSSFAYTDIDSVGFRNSTDFQLGEFLGIFGHGFRDEAASSYLEDAKDFEVEASRVCSRIDSYDAKLSRIEDQMEVEERIIDTLTKQIALKNANDKAQIAQAIKNLLNLVICDRNGEVQQKYVQELDKLKRFC